VLRLKGKGSARLEQQGRRRRRHGPVVWAKASEFTGRRMGARGESWEWAPDAGGARPVVGARGRRGAARSGRQTLEGRKREQAPGARRGRRPLFSTTVVFLSFASGDCTGGDGS
jgi:hypothetical protein